MFLLIYHIIHIIDDNRNNLEQLGVRKRTCFVGTAISINNQQLKKNIVPHNCMELLSLFRSHDNNLYE